MSKSASAITAINAPNEFAEVSGRKLAYRSIGNGKPFVLCTRFHGTMDLWDPAFLDTLARSGFRVITFDYRGLGLSTGERTYNPMELARDANDLMEALDLKDVVIGGWSLGGLVAQVVLTMFPARLSHAVLLATSPPGPIVKEAEQLFYDTAVHPVNSFEDDVILFFEPRSKGSRAAARRSADRIAQRTDGRSPTVPWEWASSMLGTAPRNPASPRRRCWRPSRARPFRSCTSAAATTSSFRSKTGTR